MGATYTALDYLGFFLTYTIGSILAVGVLSVCVGRILAVKTQRGWIAYLPWGAWVLFMFLMGIYAVPVFKQTGDLLIPSEYTIKTTVGEIKSIVPADNFPLSYIDGEICGIDCITVNEEHYYVISEDLLEEGMLVELQYAALEHDIVLDWYEVSKEHAAQVLQTQKELVAEENTEASSEEISQGTKDFALLLYWVGLIGFLGLVAIAYLFRNKLADYLFINDAKIHAKIVPNRFFVIFAALPLLFISMIFISVMIESGEYHALLVLTIGSGIMLFFVLVDQCTYLKIDGEAIILCKLGKEKQYALTQIHTLKWKSCRGIIGRQLVVVFDDGRSYWFNMDYFKGVQNTYNELAGRMNSTLTQEE